MGPVQVVAIRARSDQLQVDSILRYPTRVPPEFGCVLLGCEVPPASPTLVPDAPVADFERIGKPSLLSYPGQICCPPWRVAILDPTIETQRRQAPQICGKVGLSANELAKTREFICAEGV